MIFPDYGSDMDKPKKAKHPTKVLNRKHTPALIKLPPKLTKCKSLGIVKSAKEPQQIR